MRTNASWFWRAPWGSSSLLGHEQKLFTSFLHQSLKLINHKRLVIFLLLLQHKPQWYFPPWLESPLAPHIKNKSYGGKLSVLLVFRYLERGDPTLDYSLCVWSNVWYVHCYIHHPSITWRVLNSEPPLCEPLISFDLSYLYCLIFTFTTRLFSVNSLFIRILTLKIKEGMRWRAWEIWFPPPSL